MTKKSHLIYSIISICALIAYCGFLVKNSITEVDTVEETLPYNSETEAFESEAPEAEPTESIVSVFEPEAVPAEEPTASAKEPETFLIGFSPLMPVEGSITKEFSLKHSFNEQTGDWRAHGGIDIEASAAAPVFAVEDGAVVSCYTDPLWGNVIEIDHGEYISVYKNLSTLIMVKEGDSVTRGEKISGVGETSTTEKGAPHLHFELYCYGELVDPLSLIG